MNKYLSQNEQEISILKRGFRQFDEVHKTNSRIENDLRLLKLFQENCDRTIQMNLDIFNSQFEQV